MNHQIKKKQSFKINGAAFRNKFIDMKTFFTAAEQIIEKDFVVAEIEAIIEQGGPEANQYNYVDYLFEELSQKIQKGEIEMNVATELINQCTFLNTSDSVMGHIRQKPFGYAGDYMIIERIYLNQPDASTDYYKWDEYSLSHLAAQAVRNRKDYFKSVMKNRIQQSDKQLRLLDVASGPARDLKELFEKIEKTDLQVTCVEMDSRAIEHAKSLNINHLEQIEFVNQNIFKFRTEEKFDIVWSAGLFDYFDDKGFKMVLRKLIDCASEKGEIIIGNFNDENPSRTYMEMVGDWILHHRSEDQLIKLAIEAGANPAKIWVGQEPEGINLFLHIWK